jgi:hypothetical protein
MACSPASECIAVGGTTLQKTTSGSDAGSTWNGTSWALAALPANTTDLFWAHCAPGGNCFVTASDGTGLVSTNGGSTWTDLSLLTSYNGQSVDTGAPAFVDNNNGWFVGNTTACDTASPGCRGVIQHTTNGGTTWSWENTPASMGPMENIACPNSSECIALGLSGPVAAAYATYDGGSTWSALELLFGLANANGVACGDANHCYITGEAASTNEAAGSVIFATTDGGHTWTVEPIPGPSDGVVDIACPSASTCLAGGFSNDLVAEDGGVFNFNAPFYGSAGNYHLNKPIVAIIPDAATGGYWLVASDGGVFSFNAPFYGGTGGVHLNQPVVSAAPTPDGHGYWLVASDGGVFTEGDARFYGSTGNVHLAKPIVGAASSS